MVQDQIRKRGKFLITGHITQMHFRNQYMRQIGLFLLIFAFFLCGVVGFLCPMVTSAYQGEADAPSSHHSPIANSSDCPDELTRSAEKSSELYITVLSPINLDIQAQILDTPTCFSVISDATRPGSPPLLFLLLSNLRN